MVAARPDSHATSGLDSERAMIGRLPSRSQLQGEAALIEAAMIAVNGFHASIITQARCTETPLRSGHTAS
jgi:hypothetical protein